MASATLPPRNWQSNIAKRKIEISIVGHMKNRL